ncbi:Maf family protein [Qingshengfaniella alkalisoli]|uniref:Nucleoside triphosphate pyrophosphatase n=1 Tax=Qingshengfaniella alkalisoli TaxID=2599296 RepID=A0A5B8I7X1_9RHOB|nr:Maf family protein [Qingshengfaniella alkalisoli]QDY69985.1 septum formation protein Maf [Qingshengfaniella alkalisoli]
MNGRLILASNSATRRTLLVNAGLDPEIIPARVDESSIRASLQAEQASSRDIADALAEMKALRVSEKHPGALVLGCDQVLDVKGEVLAKPDSKDELRVQLDRLRGTQHSLLSAAVIYEDGKPLWRHVGVARLTMRPFSDTYRDDYIERNWDEVCHCVGGYMLEAEGVRLFSRIEGDYFTILGLPLLELLGYLTIKGVLPQ